MPGPRRHVVDTVLLGVVLPQFAVGVEPGLLLALADEAPRVGHGLHEGLGVPSLVASRPHDGFGIGNGSQEKTLTLKCNLVFQFSKFK